MNKNSGQTRANKKWQDKNREYTRYLNARSAARGFIRNRATLEDLEELKNMIEEKEKDLNK
ncbi:Uncharacterised protein [Anaerococcus prevotii]|uniref:Uncharacterized protein n=1 Tax=Anaerococcus prevotii (strain ATCC 9321 / DSM 20548 / JCM 6508 / NCTC 11806 / PC1) TaxID=525919 RepID=C7RHD4_ANAPD|nr:hypothetical protein [Anaerococcus prevotii]ACV28895.1 hypothetical protein Apre_0867 [Anaerococcus prevotii DSM 20548]SUU94568.1 Uncharacterised protein [Anaerococcus prevotii]